MKEDESSYTFSGSVSAYRFLHPNIRHYRKIVKQKDNRRWIVQDNIENKPQNIKMKQIWHPSNLNLLRISSLHNSELEIRNSPGWYSSKYGSKELTEDIVLEVESSEISTIIEVK